MTAIRRNDNFVLVLGILRFDETAFESSSALSRGAYASCKRGVWSVLAAPGQAGYSHLRLQLTFPPVGGVVDPDYSFWILANLLRTEVPRNQRERPSDLAAAFRERSLDLRIVL
ncbi:MAG: hypothetical protein AAF546_12080, partial [Verrucomicrobiota bacterium]